MTPETVFGENVLFGKCSDIAKTRVTTDRSTAFPNQFRTVVVHGIMACRDHDTAADIALEGLEVDFFRPAQADIDDIRATVQKAFGHSLGQRWALQAHIVADDNLSGIEVISIGQPDTVSNVGFSSSGTRPRVS